MSFAVLLALAVALAMDCFAVSLAIALSLKKPSRGQMLRLASSFGGCQFIMSLLGWLAGRGLLEYIQGIDHWVAFGLLAFIGGKMIYESMVIGREGEGDCLDPTRGMSLLMLSLATSIDSMGVGLSLSLLGVEIIYPAVIIGMVSFVGTCIGMKIGGLRGSADSC
ncbi:MAG: manganese efflux pump MntP family protein [bacterium]